MRSFLMYCMLIGLLCSCEVTGQSKQLSPDQFEKQLTTGPQLLDVRTAGEYQSGHLAGSMQADWTSIGQFKDRVQHLDKSKPVLVYCLSGNRSASAAQWMRNNGFTDVQELKGGINAWKMAGKSLEGQANVQQYTLADYQQLVGSTGRVLVDFGATWCPPCRLMEPVLAALEKDPSLQFTLKKIDGGVHTDVMQTLKVEALPTFIIYENGKEVWRHQGVLEQAELAKRLGSK